MWQTPQYSTSTSASPVSSGRSTFSSIATPVLSGFTTTAFIAILLDIDREQGQRDWIDFLSTESSVTHSLINQLIDCSTFSSIATPVLSGFTTTAFIAILLDIDREQGQRDWIDFLSTESSVTSSLVFICEVYHKRKPFPRFWRQKVEQSINWLMRL
ncbi:Uncharacterised protein [Streptococcus pneumoniae]|nr:Uncharacterised protein [Streptococcus pneumoniae]